MTKKSEKRIRYSKRSKKSLQGMTNVAEHCDSNTKDICVGKRTYTLRNDAKRAGSFLGKMFDIKFRPYRCKVCKCYHLTKTKKRDV